MSYIPYHRTKGEPSQRFQKQSSSELLKSALCNKGLSSLTLSQTTKFRRFQTERVCRRQFGVENGRKFLKWVEKNVGNGEIAYYEQFLLFPVFSKDLHCRHVKTRACLGKALP